MIQEQTSDKAPGISRNIALNRRVIFLGGLLLCPFEQALGTGIASELDLAYWHARYTAASRFDAGGVAADTVSSSSTSHVVPPPEVYFISLAYHVPSVAELRALPGLDTNPALRTVLNEVFDFPVGDVGASSRQSTGVIALFICFLGGARGCGRSRAAERNVASRLFRTATWLFVVSRLR